jgi:predicted metal-dependent TIM-barrel fold hydrolase
MTPGLALMNRLDERLVETVVREGFVAGVSVGASNLNPRKAARLLADVIEKVGSSERIVLDSALRSGGSDILGIPKTIVALQELGVEHRTIERLAYGNAMALFVRQQHHLE